MSNTETNVGQEQKTNQFLTINGAEAAALSGNTDDFFLSNKKTTTDYRAALAQAIGTTGTIAKITKMAFGVNGEIDEQGNPAPPSDNGPLNEQVIEKGITEVTYPVSTTVCFEARIGQGEVTAAINEVALIDENGTTAAKMRLLTSKGTDAESGLIFKWYVEF